MHLVGGGGGGGGGVALRARAVHLDDLPDLGHVDELVD